jgi:hypothetical protein
MAGTAAAGTPEEAGSVVSVTHMSRRDTRVSHAHVTGMSHPWRHMKSRSRSRSLYMGRLLLLPTDIRDASEQQTIGEG